MARLVYFRRWYDHVTARAIRCNGGEVPLRNEVGIFLIFPETGVLGSHYHMIDEMNSQGISPFVVSNLPLREEERIQLLPKVFRLMERPNVGYDFGGYRDGILDLAPVLSALERLWLLNDSVWLVPQSRSWFEDAREMSVEFVAASCANFLLPRVQPEKFRYVNWNFATSRRNFHYASYALGFSQQLLEDPKFLKFWNKFELRTDKTRTVRRGEIGLTQWVLKYGFSHGATFEIGKLNEELDLLNPSEIDQIARDLIIPEDITLEAIKAEVLLSDPDSTSGRADRVALILTAVARQASAYALPAYTLNRGFQFLKKSPLWLSSESSVAMLRLIERIEGPVGAQIRSEAQKLKSKLFLPLRYEGSDKS